MNANEALSELRSAAVGWVASDKRAEAGETFAYRITTYRAPNVRTAEISLNGAIWDAIKAYTYFALSGEQLSAFEVAIWTNDLSRRLLRIDSEKVGYGNAIKALTEFLSKH